MKITKNHLREIIKEELQLLTTEMNHQQIINEGYLDRVKKFGKFMMGAKKRAKQANRVVSSDSSFEWIGKELGIQAKSAAKTATMNAARTIGAAEMTGISFAIGIPALALWSVSRGTTLEGILRNQHSYLNLRNRRENKPEVPLTMNDVADPFSQEFANSYSARRGKDAPLVALIRDQELFRELKEDGIIGPDIEEWTRGWYAKIANAKQVYLRAKNQEQDEEPTS